MIQQIKSLAGKIKYGAKVLGWLADSLATFPELPASEKKADENSQRSERSSERTMEQPSGNEVREQV